MAKILDEKARFRSVILRAFLGVSVWVFGISTSHADDGELPLPELGQETALPLGEEKQLGDQLARELFQSVAYTPDVVLEQYLSELWDPLLQAARQTGALSPDLAQTFAWRLLLLKDASVNAFALPGGYFGVHLGLIALVDHPGELASVLAHEMSHVTQRHIARMIGAQNQSANWLVAAIAIAVAAAAQQNGVLAQAGLVGGQALAEQKQLNFSRDMEREADRMGWRAFQYAGFPGADFVRMFEKLDQANRFNDNGLYPYLRTHPMTRERQADMTARLLGVAQNTSSKGVEKSAEKVQKVQKGRVRLFHDPNDHQGEWLGLCMAARAQVLLTHSPEELDRWAERVQQRQTEKSPLAQQGAALYGALWMYLQDFHGGDTAELARARSHWQALKTLSALPAAPKAWRFYVTALQAEWFLQAPDAATSLSLMGVMPTEAQVVQALESPRRESRMALLLWAQLQLKRQTKRQTPELSLTSPQTPAEGSSIRQVADALTTWLLAHPDDAPAGQILAKTWELLGQKGRSLRVLAQAEMAHFGLSAALNHLLAARDVFLAQSPNEIDFAEQSVVDSLIRQTRARLAQMASGPALR
jgi:predicted Zn-dependent protease